MQKKTAGLCRTLQEQKYKREDFGDDRQRESNGFFSPGDDR